ncbi:NUDIX hydrolase [Amnibacterium setariae]|uniref:NUDIX domain-containing protein n=1 Tax=Amnibacterium setariae TaxID=2306585 RepID=A0A3A1TXE5_9MICO|nr:NUDIX hydrolase [Amnibacterium setariae]RIX26379.1 NUDIX domain-containing protein [Amnibacterium setariae]
MKTPPRPVVRNAARVLLLDPDGRVLLVRGGDPADPEAGTWWLTPGGGLEPGEDARTAALREAFEETGHRVERLTGPVARRSSVFPFDGRLIEQREQYFTARVPAFEPTTAGWTELEQRALSGFRWWTLAELRATEETVFPERLADMVSEALQSS